MATMTDTELVDGLQRLMGYVQNGSDTTVSMFQDDATHTYHVKIGRAPLGPTFWGSTMRDALQMAIERTPKEDWE
jgi:hypothetical protein